MVISGFVDAYWSSKYLIWLTSNILSQINYNSLLANQLRFQYFKS